MTRFELSTCSSEKTLQRLWILVIYSNIINLNLIKLLTLLIIHCILYHFSFFSMTISCQRVIFCVIDASFWVCGHLCLLPPEILESDNCDFMISKAKSRFYGCSQ